MGKRMDAIRSFKYLTPKHTPDSQFIPAGRVARELLYAKFKAEGVILPKYENFNRKALRRRDMRVLNEPIDVRFRYKSVDYEIVFYKGFCWDGASVPTWAVFGNVSKFNQYVILSSMIHDTLFALKLMSFEDSNNVFSGSLRAHNLNKFALSRYMFGVRSIVGKQLYKKGDPSTSWLNGYYELKILS